MKTMKKLVALLLAAMMVLSMGVTAFAEVEDDPTKKTGSIEIMNPIKDEVYTASKIFDVTYSWTDQYDDSDDTDSKYAYSISKDSDWLSAVQAYAANDGSGLTLTESADKTKYLVTFVKEDQTTDPAVNGFRPSDFAEEMKNAGIAGDITFTDTANGTKKATGLELGYYIVMPTNGSLCDLTTTDPDVLVYDKNEEPTVSKIITDAEYSCGKEAHEHSDACYTESESGEKTLTCTKGEHVHTDDCKRISEASVGDSVPYEVTTKVPDMTGYDTYFFVVEDTLSAGLTFNDDVTITLNGTPLTKDTDYSVKVTENGDGTTLVRIVFKNMKQYWANDPSDDLVGAPIKIGYSATLNEKALVGEANKNAAKVVFSNDPNVTPKDDPENPNDDPDDPENNVFYYDNDPDNKVEKPTGVSEKSETETYAAKLQLKKVDGKNPDTTLKGAKFQITGTSKKAVLVNEELFKEDANGEYWRLKDGTYTTTAPKSDKDSTYEYVSWTCNPAYKVTENPDGGSTTEYFNKGLYVKVDDEYILIDESNAGTYKDGPFFKLVTTVQDPDAYDSVTKRYSKFENVTKDNCNDTDYNNTGITGNDGLLSFSALGEGTYTITELEAPEGYNLLTSPITVAVTFDENEKKFNYTVDGGDEITLDSDGILTFDVKNNAGKELPETGGIGTTIFYILGGVMLVGAAVLLITKRRMNA